MLRPVLAALAMATLVASVQAQNVESQTNPTNKGDRMQVATADPQAKPASQKGSNIDIFAAATRDYDGEVAWPAVRMEVTPKPKATLQIKPHRVKVAAREIGQTQTSVAPVSSARLPQIDVKELLISQGINQAVSQLPLNGPALPSWAGSSIAYSALTLIVHAAIVNHTENRELTQWEACSLVLGAFSPIPFIADRICKRWWEGKDDCNYINYAPRGDDPNTAELRAAVYRRKWCQ